MEQGYLIDTNVIIDFCEKRLGAAGESFVAAVIDDSPFISVINKIELLSFSEVTREIQLFLNVASILGLSDTVIDRTIEVRKVRKMKLPDAIIAATALDCNLFLLTRNVRDFNGIPGLQVIDPYALDL